MIANFYWGLAPAEPKQPFGKRLIKRMHRNLGFDLASFEVK